MRKVIISEGGLHIPAKVYYSIVMMYARAKGLPFWKYENWLEAAQRYNRDAALLN